MSIVNELGFTVPSLEDTIFVTCSALMSTAASTGAVGMLSVKTTADAITGGAGTAATKNGNIVDRLASLMTSRHTVAWPVTVFLSTRGSTEANRQLTIGVKLQHGDSSGGGDMADLSTGSTPADRVYFTTARTSDMANWDSSGSTGPFRGVSDPAYYDLRAAKRFIRGVHSVAKNRVTTESSGDEGARVSGYIMFVGADKIPQPTDVAFSSTTTTT